MNIAAQAVYTPPHESLLAHPKGSADLFFHSDHYENLYGKDFFYIVGISSMDLDHRTHAAQIKLIPINDRIWFSLSHNKIAVNDTAEDIRITPLQKVAREMFLSRHAKKAKLYPFVSEVRAGKAFEDGVPLSLLASGALLMTRGSTGEVRVGLQQRTSTRIPTIEQWGLTRALVTGQNDLGHSMFESLVPVSVFENNKCMAHALYVEDEILPFAQYSKTLTSKETIDELNLELKKLDHQGPLLFQATKVDVLHPRDLGLPYGDVVIHDDRHGLDQNICNIPGCWIYEEDTHTLTYRLAVSFSPDPKAIKIKLIDSSGLAHPGAFFSRGEVEHHIRIGNANTESNADGMSPSALAILDLMVHRYWNLDGTLSARETGVGIHPVARHRSLLRS